MFDALVHLEMLAVCFASFISTTQVAKIFKLWDTAVLSAAVSIVGKKINNNNNLSFLIKTSKTSSKNLSEKRKGYKIDP